MEEEKRNSQLPDRYYTPQLYTNLPFDHVSIVQSTPRPESVVIKRDVNVSKRDPCWLACILACFLCCAVKGETEKPP